MFSLLNFPDGLPVDPFMIETLNRDLNRHNIGTQTSQLLAPQRTDQTNILPVAQGIPGSVQLHEPKTEMLGFQMTNTRNLSLEAVKILRVLQQREEQRRLATLMSTMLNYPGTSSQCHENAMSVPSIMSILTAQRHNQERATRAAQHPGTLTLDVNRSSRKAGLVPTRLLSLGHFS